MAVRAWLCTLVLLGDIQTAAQETMFYKYGEIPANDTAIFPATSIKKKKKKSITSFMVTTTSPWDLHGCARAHCQAFLCSPDGRALPQPPSRHL